METVEAFSFLLLNEFGSLFATFIFVCHNMSREILYVALVTERDTRGICFVL